MNDDQAKKIIALLESIDAKLDALDDGPVEVFVMNSVEVEGTVRTREACD